MAEEGLRLAKTPSTRTKREPIPVEVNGTERRTAGRLAGYLFIGSGLVTLLNVFIALPPDANGGVLVVISALAVSVGVGALLAPWSRWPAPATLVVVPLALALITVGNAVGGDDPYTYAVYFVVLFVWVVADRGLAPETALAAAAGGPVPAGVLAIEIPGPAGRPGCLVVGFGDEGCPDDGFSAPAARIFAAKVARAMEQVQVVEALTDAALRDGLTGLGNRRHADALLASLAPGDAVVVIDIDHFKLVNDAHGHVAGDRVLVALGRFLRDNLRRSDDVARLGGEEFLVVLRNEPNARATAQRLVEAWRALGQPATISAGVDTHEVGRAVSETMVRADQALYQAKGGGRDRAVAAAREAAPQP